MKNWVLSVLGKSVHTSAQAELRVQGWTGGKHLAMVRRPAGRSAVVWSLMVFVTRASDQGPARSCRKRRAAAVLYAESCGAHAVAPHAVLYTVCLAHGFTLLYMVPQDRGNKPVLQPLRSSTL